MFGFLFGLLCTWENLYSCIILGNGVRRLLHGPPSPPRPIARLQGMSPGVLVVLQLTSIEDAKVCYGQFRVGPSSHSGARSAASIAPPNAALLHAKWLKFLSTCKSPSESYTEYLIHISLLTPRLSGSPPKVRLRRSAARSCCPSLCSPVFHSTTTFTKHLPPNPTSLLRRLPKLASVSTQVTRSSNERTSLR